MSSDAEYKQRIERIVARDPRYRFEAYEFVGQAVAYTAKKIKETAPDAGRHISGQQLLDGFRELATQQFGCLAFDVLTDWGLTVTDDVGTIVFNLVHDGLLGASDQDSPQDFASLYTFDEAFCQPFRVDPVHRIELPQLL